MSDPTGKQQSKKNGESEKFIKITYHSDSNIELESNGIGPFDLWSLSRFLSLKGDELYINAQTRERMLEAATRNPIVLPRPGMKL